MKKLFVIANGPPFTRARNEPYNVCIATATISVCIPDIFSPYWTKLRAVERNGL